MSEEIILKSREDKRPIILKKEDGKYTVFIDKKRLWASQEKPSWAKGVIDEAALRHRIEPWLTALFQSEHFALLIGAGLTKAVHDLARPKEEESEGEESEGEESEEEESEEEEPKEEPEMPVPEFSEFEKEIEKAAGISNKKDLSTTNIESLLRVANELLVGLKHLNQVEKNGEESQSISALKKEITDFLKKFTEYILELEKGIATSAQNKEQALNYLVSFLTSFASRSGTRDRLQIFTTNYDRVIETGAEIAGLHLLDRFVGSISPIFRSSRLDIDMHYNPPGIRGEPRYLEGVIHFTKLHGSIDWKQLKEDIIRVGLPFGAKNFEGYLEDFKKLMVYPNTAKDKETAEYPYVEMFRDFAASICRPNSTLVTYGYSYSDDHINRIIKDMLTIPSTHLIIIAYEDTDDRIIKMYKKIGRPAQMTLLIGEGLADLKSLVDNYLPKAAIDRITSRMIDLLKSRLDPKDNSEEPSSSPTQEGLPDSQPGSDVSGNITNDDIPF